MPVTLLHLIIIQIYIYFPSDIFEKQNDCVK